MSVVPATDKEVRRLAELLAGAPGPQARAEAGPWSPGPGIEQMLRVNDVASQPLAPAEALERLARASDLETFLRERFAPSRPHGWESAARAVLARPASGERAALLRSLLLAGPHTWPADLLAGLLQALFDAGVLDDTVLHPLLRWGPFPWRLGPGEESPYREFRNANPSPHPEGDPRTAYDLVGADCREAMAASLDRLVELLTAVPDEKSVAQLPRWRPRGPRFFLRALDLWRAEVDSPSGARWAGRTAVYLARARLTAGERDWLLAELETRPLDARRAALALSTAAAPKGVVPLLEAVDAEDARGLVDFLQGPVPMVDEESGALDVAALQGVTLSAERAAELLPLLCADSATVAADLAGLGSGSAAASGDVQELVLAWFGLNRTRVRKRLRQNAYSAIRALGLLPLQDGESVLDRYLELRGCAKAAARFGAERRANHLLAVRAGLWHLSQISGYPSADRLEWDLEARLAEDTPDHWSIGAYTVALDLRDPAVPLLVERAGKRLASVPKPVRADPLYAEARAAQDRMREQARRLRSGLVEPLVADGELLPAEAFERLLVLPAARAMLGALVLRTGEDALGLLDLSGPEPSLVGLDGARVPIGTRIGAAHPVHLAELGALAGWQREIVRRRLRQPVKQVFRELYPLTPAERAAGYRSLRFAGRPVNGAVAARLLAGRGWRGSADEGAAYLTRDFGGCHAVLHFEEIGHFLAEGTARTGPAEFVESVHRRDFRRVLGGAVPLADVPAQVLSEAMRDIDLVVSVAAADEPDNGWADPDAAGGPVAARAELVAALVDDLGLGRVTVDGRYAMIDGSRARYRVHLGSGSVHLEPGGYVCIVPAALTQRPHRDVFLPFADEDTPSSVVISKVLLLAEDERIEDPSILRQIAAAGR